MERDANNCPTCCINHSQMGKAQRFTLMSFLIGSRRRIWRPWGVSFRRINSHLLIQLPPRTFLSFLWISASLLVPHSVTYWQFVTFSSLPSQARCSARFCSFVWTYTSSYEIIHEITIKVLYLAANKKHYTNVLFCIFCVHFLNRSGPIGEFIELQRSVYHSFIWYSIENPYFAICLWMWN